MDIVEDATHQKRHMRDLLLANLDLIQQQQELLLEKDVQLQALQRENETLKCRLERMERRMMLQVKQPAQKSNTSFDGPPAHGNANMGPEHRPRSAKRKLTEETSDVGSMIETVASAPSISEKQAKRSERVRLDESSNNEHSKKGKCGKVRSLRSAGDTMNDQTSVPKLPGRDASSNAKFKASLLKRTMAGTDLLTTDTLYYSSAYQDSIQPDTSTIPSITDIPVPSWRINVVHSKYVMEGTENLNDPVFMKRHQKSETEEKRRKRWDMQRLRDLYLLQKHQRDDNTSDTQQQVAEPFTFLPESEKVRFVDVSDHIPVSAFGHGLPKVAVLEFSLPWSISSTERRTTKSKQNKRLASIDSDMNAR